MAGFYPDVPAPRMAYDRDGTVGFYATTTGLVTQLSVAQMQGMNDEDNGESIGLGAGFDGWFGLIFPQPRELIGYTFSYGYSGTFSGAIFPQNLQTSTNTSTGFDGAWSTVLAGQLANIGNNDRGAQRQNISLLNATDMKAVRFRVNATNNTTSIFNWHLYGGLMAGQTPDRLRLWHPVDDAPLDDNSAAHGAYFDWGDVVRGTTQDRSFRIKNNSASLTANSIDISAEAPTNTTPSVSGQLTFSDGGAFSQLINIGSLSPGSISPVVTVRRATVSNATLSLWTGRLNINPGSWS